MASIRNFFVFLHFQKSLNLLTMKKSIWTIGCCVAILVGSCNSAKTSEDGMTCGCAEKKDSLEIIMNIPVKIKPEFVSAYIKAFEKCQAGTLKEEACLAYALFQSYSDSTEFHLFERWTNKPGHNFHMETAHFLQYREETRGMNDRASSRMITTYVCPCVNE